jgi:hypothetical protein
MTVHLFCNSLKRVRLLGMNRPEKQMQILRLSAPHLHPSDEDLSPGTPELHPSDEDLSPGTPELRYVWGPFRSG